MPTQQQMDPVLNKTLSALDETLRYQYPLRRPHLTKNLDATPPTFSISLNILQKDAPSVFGDVILIQAARRYTFELPSGKFLRKRNSDEEVAKKSIDTEMPTHQDITKLYKELYKHFEFEEQEAQKEPNVNYLSNNAYRANLNVAAYEPTFKVKTERRRRASRRSKRTQRSTRRNARDRV
jgi:hypothetical protein